MKMFKLLIFIAIFIFAGCASSTSKEKIVLSKFENKTYNIAKIVLDGDGLKLQSEQEAPNITFENDKFYGFSGCNRFFGTYKIDGNSLIIEGDRVASTQMLCHPIEIMDFENNFLSNLKGSFTINYEDDKLVLKNKKMQIYFK